MLSRNGSKKRLRKPRSKTSCLMRNSQRSCARPADERRSGGF
nr:MAG TPA_asm: hypothetical protein [Caudoviricetes sp.]